MFSLMHKLNNTKLVNRLPDQIIVYRDGKGIISTLL